MGGKASMKNRTKAQRVAMAKKAAAARWGKRVKIAAILVLLSLAAPLSAQEKPSQPARETVGWISALAAGYVFDHKTSIDWSSKPTNCAEGNRFRRNPDGTLNGWKAARYEVATGAAAAGVLYLSKRFHWRYVEVAAKSFTVAQVAESTWYGVSSLRLCHEVIL